MNVPYNEINLTDAAQMIGVDYTTVAGWCRRGKINFIDISEGTKKPRYLLTEKEVEHLKTERKKNGRRFIESYDKNWDLPEDIEYEEELTTPPQRFRKMCLKVLLQRRNSTLMISRQLFHTCRISRTD